MPEERLTFKEMCAQFDVTPRTLRYYEYIELLFPEKDGRSRLYRPSEIARMTLILRGRRWGFSLEEIRQWLEIYEKEGTEAQYREFLRLADRQLEALAKERAQLDETIDDLAKMREGVAKDLDQA
ncbi:MAG: MerR family DNA-binding transcriptional regulator [Silicimonas sp.]|nr:MerR family DNA-binding transcriptional regulator [Silicimonas sp.]